MKVFVGLLLLSSFAQGATCGFQQNEFIWRNDNGTEVTATSKAAQNTNLTGQVQSQNVRLRIGGVNTPIPSVNLNTSTIVWKASHNGGAYTVVNTASSALGIIATTSTHVADQTATTQQITSGTFTAACVSATGSCTAANIATNGGVIEAELIVQFVAGQVANGDTYTFQLSANCTSYTYTLTPQVTLSVTSNTNQGWWAALRDFFNVAIPDLNQPEIRLAWSDVRP